MQKLKKWSLGLVTLLALPAVHAYQCQIDLQHHYKGTNVYINSKGDAYATVDYADGSYDAMEYVYDLKNCKKVSDGVKQKSNIRSVLNKNGFRELSVKGDLSPWLTHYYSLSEQGDTLLLKVDEVISQEQQGLRELFSYARDKSSTLGAVAESIFNTKYAKTPQFKSSIANRYFQSQNFARYATRIEQELLTSPTNLKNSVDLHFLSNLDFKLVARNSEANVFKITLEPEETLKFSKIPTVIQRAFCREISVSREYERERTGWISGRYIQTFVEKTVSCLLNNQGSDDALKANLVSSAKILGLKPDISFSNHSLGTHTHEVVLSERKIEPSPEEKARWEAQRREEAVKEAVKEETEKRCRSKLSGCLRECPSGGFLASTYENESAKICEQQCRMMYVCD